ncbi:MAG: hypothetical protein KAT46_03015 [Deltaproteobacteria bacterium]|nr:hypothetical protein [Deltaproteobacteria bacterium]
MHQRVCQFILSLCLVAIVAGCVSTQRTSASSAPDSMARVLLYLYLSPSHFQDIDFTISSAELTTDDSHLTSLPSLSSSKLLIKPVKVSAVEVGKGQQLIIEAYVKPGTYTGLRLGISSASKGIRAEADLNKRASLSVQETSAETVLPFNISLKKRESFVINLEWSPGDSIKKRVYFSPSIKVFPEQPSASDSLLFVSNSGSNYISIIDMTYERVIGAISVGERPMGMALNSTKDTLFVVNSKSRSLSVIDLNMFEVQRTVELMAGIEPLDITFVSESENSLDGKLYINNRHSNDVTVLGSSTQRLIRIIPVGDKPSHIASNSVRKEVYVTNEGTNTLSIINTIDDTLTHSVQVDTKPVGIVTGEDKLFILSEFAGLISTLPLSDRKVTDRVPVFDPPSRGVTAYGERLFIASSPEGKVIFLNENGVELRTLKVGKEPVGLAVDEFRNRLYVTNYGENYVSLLDIISERNIADIMVGEKPYGALKLER